MKKNKHPADHVYSRWTRDEVGAERIIIIARTYERKFPYKRLSKDCMKNILPYDGRLVTDFRIYFCPILNYVNKRKRKAGDESKKISTEKG